MDELKKIIEAIGKAFETFKSANDLRIKAIEEKGYADPLLTAKVDAINADISKLSAMKAQLEAIETAVARGQFPGGGSSVANPAIADYNAAHGNWMRTGVDAGLRDLSIQAAMTTQDDPTGGFLLPDPIHGPMKEVLSKVSQMRNLASVITITGPEYKSLVDLQGETAEDASETSTRNETDTPTFAEVSILPQEMSAKPKITQTMLDDAAFDTEAFVGRFLGRAFANKEGNWFWNGTGIKQAKGINAYTKVVNADYAWGKVGFITSGNANLLNNADKIFDLQHALRRQYRAGSTFLMNDTTLLSIRKLKDGEGRYIWMAGLLPGAPDTLLGKPIAIDDFVDDIGANKFPIWYADFKEAYLIVDRMGVRMLRDPYSSKPYVEFYTTKRTGAGIILYEAAKCLKIAA